MAVGTGVTAVPLPAPTPLIPMGTLEVPGAVAAAGATLFTPEAAAPVVVAPVVVVVVAGGLDVRCARPKVLATVKPAAIKIVRKAILGSLRTA